MTQSTTSIANLEEKLTAQLADAQRQLDSLREQLTETQRLATIGTIAAVIAHEFNNLLTPIISYSQYALGSAQTEKPDMEMVKKALSKSAQSAEKASKICASLLGLARGQPVLGKIEVQKVVDEVLIVLAREPKKDGITLRVQIEPGLTVRGDAVQIEQVMLNLLINARQAMLGRGGSLTIKAARLEETGEAKVQIIDTGCGIPEKLMPRIFQPFFTTKGTARAGEQRGTGLGLAICKEIIGRHGGRIGVESRVGEGTTFTLYFPLA